MLMRSYGIGTSICACYRYGETCTIDQRSGLDGAYCSYLGRKPEVRRYTLRHSSPTVVKNH